MTALDRAALLAWLADRPSRNPLVASIYAGLTTRIERGDFDTEETT